MTEIVRACRVRVLLAFGVLLCVAIAAEARPYRLVWDANIDGVTTGYRVYYGTAPGTYQPVDGVDVGNFTEFQLNLTPGQTYYFMVRAYDSEGTFGPNSNELQFVVPPDATVLASPLTVVAGQTITVTISNGTGDQHDWVGLYAVGAPAGSHLQRKYLNGLATPPASGVTNAVVSFTAPGATGSYEVRFFSDDSFTVFGTSQTISVVGPATISQPTNGNPSFDTSNNVQWNSVASAEGYYLWVGSSPGAQDLINTGEIVATQAPASSLPAATTVYATLWTKFNGSWYQTTSSFTTSAQARWIYPTANAIGVTSAQQFSWTPVPGATAYYLWVGTTPNGTDLVNTGEIAQTTYTPALLPSGATLHATIWAKVNNNWYGRQISFSTSPAATWLYPGTNTSAVPMTTPLQWSAVPDAQSYYLWIGSAPGTSDLVDTGEIQQLQYLASNLQPATTVYATIWTRHNGDWWGNSKTFTTSPSTSWSMPVTSGMNLIEGTMLEWAAVNGAQAYYLWIGTSLDGQDVLNTGEIQTTQYSTSGLPTGQTLYANIWVKHSDAWYSTRTTFTLLPRAASWISPSQPTLPSGQPLQWSSVTGAQAYYLWVGTSPGAQNVVNTGEIQATSYPSTSLPTGTLLHATIWTKFAGVWTSSTTSFTVQ